MRLGAGERAREQGPPRYRASKGLLEWHAEEYTQWARPARRRPRWRRKLLPQAKQVAL
jgi:hypothetical protein